MGICFVELAVEALPVEEKTAVKELVAGQ